MARDPNTEAPPDRVARDPQAPIGTSPGTSRRMPTLGWIIVALVIGVLAIAFAQWRGTWRTPSGGSAPMAASDSGAVMPQTAQGPPASSAAG